MESAKRLIFIPTYLLCHGQIFVKEWFKIIWKVINDCLLHVRALEPYFFFYPLIFFFLPIHQRLKILAHYQFSCVKK